MRKYVIVGSGAAGIAAAEAIRSVDAQGEVTLVSQERDGYYSRPGLAYYLTGEISEEYLFPFHERDFQHLNLRRLHARALRILPQEHRLELDDRPPLAYDRLLMSVGASAVRSDVPGAGLDGVVRLDSLEETRQILRRVHRGHTAVVVGGGITALEIVEGLRARHMKVQYLLRDNRYWANVLEEAESRWIERRLQHDGVQIHFQADLVEILGKRGQVSGVRLRDGRQIACQMVAVAIGVRPRLILAETAGLKVERGVLVDETLRTSDPDIYAAGDVAQVFDPLSGKATIASLWGPSRQQGHIAGLNMAGQSAVYARGVPFNVTRLAGLTTTLIGTIGAGEADRDVLGIARGDSETWRVLPDAIAAQAEFDVNRLRLMVGGNRLAGAVLMGDQTLSQALYHLVAGQADITPIREALLQPGARLADLLADFWITWRRQHAAK